MIVFELSEVMSVQQYVELKGWMKENNYKQEYVAFPDGRTVEWFDDRMIHQFLFEPEPSEPVQEEPQAYRAADLPKEPKIYGPKFEGENGTDTKPQP